jgi:hypothetical protein
MTYKKTIGILLVLVFTFAIEFLGESLFRVIKKDSKKSAISSYFNQECFANPLLNSPFKLKLPVIFNNYCPDYYENFSFQTSTWDIINNDRIMTEYLNGEYRMYVKNGPGIVYIYPNASCLREDYSIEVDVRWVGNSSAGYGIFFGLNNDKYLYEFVIGSDSQRYGLNLSNINGYEYPLQNATYSSFINRGTSVNRLKAVRKGTSIILYVNGIKLGTWYDGTINGKTKYGILSSCGRSIPATDTRFDNFRVMNITTP